MTEQLPAAVLLDMNGTFMFDEGRFAADSDDRRFVGMLSREALREALESGAAGAGLLVAADLVRPHAERVTPEDSLLTALRRLGANDVDYLPVVQAGAPDRLAGVLSRQDLLAAYERALTTEKH